MKNNNLNWAIIGGGNGGQTMAGHLGVKGFSVKLFDVFEGTIDAINELGGIELTGAIKGFGKVEMASTDIGKVLEGTDIAVVVLPSLYHESIARQCAPHLKDGQIVVLHPSSTFGSLEFKKVLKEENCTAKVTIADTSTLLYACRVEKPGHSYVFGIKNSVLAAALPATENKKVLEYLNTAFPEFVEATNVLETGLENLNAMLHPGPTLLNTSRIDSQEDWLYYYDGITPTIGQFVEDMDKERLAVGKAVGLKLKSVKEWYEIMYDAYGETLSEQIKDNKSYEGLKGQKTLKTRYLLEDIPNSLVPMVSLGKKLGVDVCCMETIVNLAKHILKGDLRAKGRTVKNLGISELTPEQLIEYVEKGVC